MLSVHVLGVFFLMASSLITLLARHWRLFLVALAVQYVGVFWLVALDWPLGLSAVKLVVGWMAGAMLAANRLEEEFVETDQLADLSGKAFRVLAMVIIWVLMFAIAPTFQSWIPGRDEVLWGGLVLIGSGLLQLGLFNSPLRVSLGLLSMMGGFEILYSVVENSILVTGLLAMANLGIALVGAYLISLPELEVIEE
jgi:hypothetical protein